MNSAKRPWGLFKTLAIGDDPELGPIANVKFIVIEPYQRLSLQQHDHRDETFFVISGDLELQIGEETVTLRPGDTTHVRRLTKHRLGATHEPVALIEISYGKFDEDDIVRFADDYGR